MIVTQINPGGSQLAPVRGVLGTLSLDRTNTLHVPVRLRSR
jgi:hypothetical protein